MAHSAQFWDRIAERYARKPVADEASYQHKLKTAQAYLKPNMDILEIGCGTGSTAITHAPFVRHILATDVSESMLAIARRKAMSGRVANVDFCQGSLEQLDVADESKNAVLALSLLHLLTDRPATISRVYRILKSGGLFITSTACLGDSGARFLRPILPFARLLGLAPHVGFFTETQLIEELEAAGFTTEYRWRPGKDKAAFIIARKPT